ncbi:hypothetical protein GCM10010123_18330 [Pilimelia anulata]|uniref:Uncharacterized protein n=1 Tax=Pilimelia anulata TaxID=53371 RepID=A0A8J3B9Z7_9ACTN|nr:hypothetical protein GCM10010123_18330 [Pilimelia anulata]
MHRLAAAALTTALLPALTGCATLPLLTRNRAGSSPDPTASPTPSPTPSLRHALDDRVGRGENAALRRSVRVSDSGDARGAGGPDVRNRITHENGAPGTAPDQPQGIPDRLGIGLHPRRLGVHPADHPSIESTRPTRRR